MSDVKNKTSLRYFLSKKYTALMALSEGTYLGAVFSYNTYNWAIVLSYITLAIAVVYGICYFFCLRKKDEIGIGRSIALFFLFNMLWINIYTVAYYIKIFFFGYVQTGLFGAYYGTFYGLEAWEKSLNGWDIIIILPPTILTAVFYIGYYFVNNNINSSEELK